MTRGGEYVQELYEVQVAPVRRSLAKEAMQRASGRLDDGIVPLLLSLLFCGSVLYALYLVSFLLASLALTLFSNAAVTFALYCAALALATLAFLPLWAGRIRMAGLVAAGRECALSALFYYYGSPRRFLRGMLVALFCVLSVLCPFFFGAAALYAGKETLSPLAALREAREGTRGRMRAVLGFYARAGLHLIWSVLTLGVLWLLYYSHHTALAYFEMVMEKEEQT